MCIRDSPIPLTYLMTTPSMMERYTDKADAFDGLFNMVLGYGIQFLLPCIIAVSYTHLDVYKRQLKSSSTSFRWQIWCCQIKKPRLKNTPPVSYTHLDVYKRQTGALS